ncbi:MAG: hypothetical protein KIH63_004645 [Candidatus Saccharibacteria bacterium]|nr:hypothetical protein [Candidatus Saccharibacteria bacterium]
MITKDQAEYVIEKLQHFANLEAGYPEEEPIMQEVFKVIRMCAKEPLQAWDGEKFIEVGRSE